MRNLTPAAVPEIDRPVSTVNLSGVGNFLGMYGGEHIAATEFVIGATLGTWGCSAMEIVLGLLIGNALAVLSFALCCAPLACDTRLTLYSYLKRILGPHAQKFYCLVWAICSVTLAGSGICVSTTAIREVVGVPIQHEWYPTHIGFVIIALVLGIVVTIVAANGFEACAKFSSTCVPWMITIFFVGALVALPQLAEATGAQVNSIADIWAIFDANVGGGTEPYTIAHVACFAWLCNLAWHMGCNDMGLMRFAGNWKYGFVTTIGMYVGHFYAWIAVAFMGAAASAVLKVALSTLDPGSVTYTVFGMTGIAAVVVAGWTTANPTIYRTALSLNTVFPKLNHKQATYIVGIIMTLLACFPMMTNIGDIVTMLGWAVVGVGAMCVTEHWLFPKIGYTRYWSMYKEKNINWAAIITWAVSIVFVLVMNQTGLLHKNFIFIPEYILSAVLYIILAGAMGARGDYSKEEAEEMQFEKDLQDMVNREMEEQMRRNAEESAPKEMKLPKVFSVIAYCMLAIMLISAIATCSGGMGIETFKPLAWGMTIVYFILNGTSTFIKYKNEANALH